MSRKKILTHGTPDENIASILAIPADRIPDEEQASLIQGIREGWAADVYAYYDPASDIWNLWHTDTRILLCPLAKRWNVIDARQEPSGYWWQVTISPPGSNETYTRRMEVCPMTWDNDVVYPTRAYRVILSVVYHCCNFDINPCLIDGTHH